MPERAKTGHKTMGGSAQRNVVPVEFGRPAALANGQGQRQPLVRIHLLGSMRAVAVKGDNILPRGKKARALLAYLCLSAGERVARTRLASLLWDNVPDHQARTSLRQALRELSVAMGPLADELISADLDTVRVEPRLCWVDALAVLSPEAPSSQVARADLTAFGAGELLEDLSGVTAAFDLWLLTERTRFAAQLRRLFESELQQLGQSDASAEQRAEIARRVIAFDTTHEGASRILMRALADMGERAQALREYERCRAALKAALDVEPSKETRSLHQAIRMFSGPSKQNENEDVLGVTRELQQTSKSSAGSGRLRVGVLPFRGEGPPRCESLAASLSQEIAAALARFRWFDVITPMSSIPGSFGSSEDLQVQYDYVVQADVTGNEEKLYISVRLFDVTEHARPLWSDHFELEANRFNRINELVVGPIVARMNPVILFTAGREKHQNRSDSTALVLRAIPIMFSMEREKFEEAGKLLTEAEERDPDNTMVAAWGAYWQVFYCGQGWARDPAAALATAQKLAVKAIRIDPENAEALGIYAHICAFLEKDFDSALHYFDRALQLNPNLAFIWALSALTCCYVGEPDLALQRLDHYRQLAPFDPMFPLWEYHYTVAFTFKGDYEKAISIGRRAVKANPDFTYGYKPLIASLGHLGRSEEAKPYIEKLLSLEPNFTVTSFGKVYPFRRQGDREHYLQGLILAGVPKA